MSEDEFPLCKCDKADAPHRHIVKRPVTVQQKWRDLARQDFDGAKDLLLRDMFGLFG